MKGRSLARVILAGLLAVTLFGCTIGGNVPRSALTVEEAKASVLAEEKRIASLIPADYVEEQKQLDSAHLISCAGGEYTWPGQGAIVLKNDPDISALLAQIAASYKKREEFTVKVGMTRDGAERVIISGRDGANYYLSPTVEGSDIDLASFSGCFKLGPDQWSGDAF